MGQITIVHCGVKNKNGIMSRVLRRALSAYGGVQWFDGAAVSCPDQTPRFLLYECTGIPQITSGAGILVFDNGFVYSQEASRAFSDGFVPILEGENKEAAKALKTTPSEMIEKITHLQGEVKALASENESLKSKLAQGALGDVMNQVVEVKGVKLLAAKVEGVDMNGLRDLGDQLKEKLGEGVVVLAAVNEGKVNLLAMATDSAQKAGAHAGNLIKAVAAIVGGGGGGRPNMAQAGGKNPEKAGEAIEAAAGILEGQIH